MRWLLVKDLQILRRSPLLVGLLVVYPVAIALMIGFALSSPPGKPEVALYDGVQRGHGRIVVGGQTLDISGYRAQLSTSLQPLIVSSRAAAIDDVRSGRAQAAVVIPAAIVQQIESLVTSGVGRPTIEIYLNTANPVERRLADEAISARLAQIQQLISKQVLRVAFVDLQQVLSGGNLDFAGQHYRLLGLRATRAIIAGTLTALPAHFPLQPALRQVVGFADLAIDGLSFATPVLGSIGSPLDVQVSQLAGRTTPVATYAASIAVIVSLMFVCLLLAAGMLALERSEHTYARLTRGMVNPATLLSEKVLLAGGCAAAVALVMASFVSLFVGLDWSRFELWVAALVVGGVSFAALGVAIGGVAREVSAASLMAVLVSLPVAFVALVPPNAVSGTLGRLLSAVAFVFPFRAALQAVSSAFTGVGPPVGLPLVHLAGLALVYVLLARIALARFEAV